MENNSFPFAESVKFGWQKTKENFWGLIAVTAIYVVIGSMFEYSAKNFEKTMPALSFTVNLCHVLINLLMTLGLTRIAFKVYAGEKFEVSELFESYRLFFKYLCATIIYFLAVTAGLIL